MKRSDRYYIGMTQGQGSGGPVTEDDHTLDYFDAARLFESTIGDGGLMVSKNGQTLTFSEACKEFGLVEDTVNRIIDLKMQINGLVSKLYIRDIKPPLPTVRGICPTCHEECDAATNEPTEQFPNGDKITSRHYMKNNYLCQGAHEFFEEVDDAT